VFNRIVVQVRTALFRRGQARIIVEVEGLPASAATETHGGVGALPYLPPEQHVTLPASEDVTAVTGYRSSTPLFFGCPARPSIFLALLPAGA
jgi:hypothetical protein